MPAHRITAIAIALLTANAAPAVAAPDSATSQAQFGGSQAWLVREDGAKDRRTIHYLARVGEAPRTLATGVRVASRTEDVALGTDASGRRIVVIATRGGLSTVPVSGGSVRRLAFSAAGDTAPSVLGGKVAFVRGTDRVMVSGLSRSRARILERASDDMTAFTDTAVGAGGSIAWIRYLESEAPRMRVELRRAGTAPRRLLELRSDLNAPGSLEFSALSTDGKRLSVGEQRGERRTERAFALPGGAPLT